MDLKISPLGGSEKEEVFEFTKKWFFPSEPVSMSWKELPKSHDVSYTRAIDQGLSLKVTDREGNLAAICVNANETKLSENAPDKLPYDLQKLYDFFDRVSSDCGKVDNCLSVMLVAVAGDYRKRGLCTILLDRTLTIAAEHGFSNVSITCTSKHSAAAAERAGWSCAFSKPYSSYRDPVSGEPLYTPPPPHTHVSMYTTSVPSKKS